ncbi:hypothetical protein HDU84_000029 [Entophlyctis sp. JEL0112]|nr:hypothetical protein HDU84_000029 [Entophlyctis sp. JEL0112]
MLSALRRCADGVVRSEDLSAVASALAEVAADVSGELFAADLSRIRNRVAFTLRCLRPTSDVDIIHGTATADDSFEALAFEDSQCNLPENATGNDVVRCVTNALNNLLDSAFDANLDHADGITRIRIFCIRIVWVTCKQLTVIGTKESCSVKSELLDFADVYLDRASDHITISLGQSPHVAELRVINTAIRCLVKLAKGQEAAALAKEFQVDFKQDWPKTAGELFLLWVSGNVHYIGGNFCAAKASFDLCIKGFRKIHSVALPAHYLNQLACTFSKLKKHETALLYFQAVLERNSQSTEALVGLSRSLRILQHREGERKVLTLIIKKEVANLQTMSNEPKQIRSLFILALRLSCLLDARSAAAMFSNLFSLFILNNSLPDVQGICDIPDISMLRRIYSLICLRASKRNRARTLARALLLDNADDVIAGVVIGRCAVLGKQISSSCSENIRVSDGEWHSGEEANYGEEDFSIFEAEKIVDGTVRLLRLLSDGRNASVEHISERCVPNSLQEDIRMKWLFCDPQRVRMLLTETLVNLSIIKWMLGKYGESQSLAVDAYVLSPKIDTVVQNLAVIYWRLGRVKDATQIWLQRRLPELQGIQTVVGTLRKEFWESVGQSIVCGMGLREAVQSEMRQRPRGILRELWDAQQGAGAAEENAQAHAHAPNAPSRWLDVQCARALCEERL